MKLARRGGQWSERARPSGEGVGGSVAEETGVSLDHGRSLEASAAVADEVAPAQSGLARHSGATSSEEPSEKQSDTVGLDFVSALAQLAELHRAGALTDEEFGAAKARVLRG